MRQIVVRAVQTGLVLLTLGLFITACDLFGAGSGCEAGFRLCVQQPEPDTCCPEDAPYYCPSKGDRPCLPLTSCGSACPDLCYLCRP